MDYHISLKTNHPVVLIGEDHQGLWANKGTANAIRQTVRYFRGKKLPVSCWYEGFLETHSGKKPKYQVC
jgi:hypothetical protein